MATEQEIFDAAWHGLKRQGWQKTGPWDSFWVQPMIVGKLRCALGHIENVLGHAAAFNTTELTVQLRIGHDRATSPADMETAMRGIAHRWGLTVPSDKEAAFARFLRRLGIVKAEKPSLEEV